MAAGMGTRFGALTAAKPKGFVPCGGMSMIERSIRTLLACGIERIVIGTGYLQESFEALKAQYPQIVCVFSPRYAETNSMYTLWNCREAIGDNDFLLLESDLVYEAKALTALMTCEEHDVMLITPVTKFQDQYYVEYGNDHQLVNCSTDATALHAKGELVGICKLSSAFYHTLCDDYASKMDSNLKMGYEFELLLVARTLRKLYVLCVEGLHWYEIDDEADLAYAETHVLPYLE